MAMVVLAFALITGAMGNVMQRLAQKTQTQASADAAAVSLATLRSRGLNAITADNHLIGELTALLVLHEAINGEKPGEADGPTQQWKQLVELVQVFNRANTVSTSVTNPKLAVILETAGNKKSAAMMYDTQMHLMNWFALTQSGMLFGVAVEKVPIVAPIGSAIIKVFDGLQFFLLKEWYVCEMLESTAQSLAAGRSIADVFLTSLSIYGDQLAMNSTLVKPSKELVVTLAQSNHVGLETFPKGELFSIPIVAEKMPKPAAGQFGPGPTGNYRRGIVDELLKPITWFKDRLSAIVKTADKFMDLAKEFPIPGPWKDFIDKGYNEVKKLLQRFFFIGNNEGYDKNPSIDVMKDVAVDWSEVQKSQFVRVAYPYVDEYRLPILGMLNNELTGIPFGNAANFYVRWSSRMTLSRTAELRKAGVHVFFLADSSSETKGKEPWVTSSDAADSRFAVSVLCTRPFPRPFSSVFGRPAVDQFVATAQALSYPTTKKAVGNAEFQPHVGWDTLAWDAKKKQAVEYPYATKPNQSGYLSFSFLKKPSPPPTELPWTVKLVPHRVMTYLKMVLSAESDALDDALPEALLLNHH